MTKDETRIAAIKSRLARIKQSQDSLFKEEAALLAELRILGHKVMKEAMLK